MNVMNVYEPVGGAAMPVAAVERRMSSATFTLRKSGARPIAFNGKQLGFQSGYRVGTPLWHELNLYQTDDGRYVADIRVFQKGEAAMDQFHVAVVETLDEAIAFFEGYDPRGDIVAHFCVDDPELSPAELMVHAAKLKYEIRDTTNQYRAVLAAFLHELNNG
jgi:hypothetical protein